MKLPIFKKLQSSLSEQEMQDAIKSLEVYAEVPSVNDDELEVIGEIISNLSAAIEVKKMVEEGMSEKDAANTFMQRVLGSIDR